LHASTFLAGRGGERIGHEQAGFLETTQTQFATGLNSLRRPFQSLIPTLQADHIIISVSILPPERIRSNPLVVVPVRMADEKDLDVSELESELLHTRSDKRDILLKIVVDKDVPPGVAIR